MHSQFTCINYDKVDFLIPSKDVVSGIYFSIKKDDKKIVFNRETLPHIYIGDLLEREFICKSNTNSCVILVLNVNDFNYEVKKFIIDYTDTALPSSGYIALSVNANISSRDFSLSDFKRLPKGIQDKMDSYGVNAIIFPKENRKQILISPDLLLKKFFTGGML